MDGERCATVALPPRTVSCKRRGDYSNIYRFNNRAFRYENLIWALERQRWCCRAWLQMQTA
jgi:hypothetical protein